MVTGEKADGTGSEESPVAAILLAKAKSGSIENIAVRWYEGGTNQSVTLPAGSNVAAGMQGCRVYAEKGIASALIGSVDAKQAGSAAGSLEISNVSLCTMEKAASPDGKKVTAHLGIEGETTAVLLGEIKSGAVKLDNSNQTEKDRKSYVCIEGTLSLKSDKGQEDSQASGGLIGRISGGENALVKQLDFTASRMEMETKGGVAGGLAGIISGGQKAGLEEISLSANSLDVTGKTAAGGAVGNVSAGELSLNKINILTTKENKQDCGKAGQETNGTEKPYGIRVTAENGTAGGLLGAASSSVTKLEITEAAVSGSGTADQVKAGSSAGGLIGDTKASNTTIMSSAVSLYIRSEGNGGNVGGSSSTDGAGGLIGSASGNVTITSSYSGGRTTNASDPEEEKSDAYAKQARYVNAEEGQGRYNVYLASGSGAAGGLLGRFDGNGSLKIENSYSTSSVAIPYSSGSTGAAAGGLVGDAGTTTLTANNTYCTGRVYANGAQNGTSVGTATGSTTGSTAGTSTPNYGTYAGKLGSINGSGNYYLKGMNGIPSDAVGTLGGKTSDITIAENVLAGSDYYDDNCALKKEVDTAQKSYYFDTALAATKYPFKTVTTAIARPVCDPDTGMRKQNAEDDTNRFAQIGDWEIPKEEASAEGAYGLIYYERIWDGTTNKLDPTFYYHGYMLESGEDAKSATYKEIHSKASFVTAKEHYVSESGYLLLIRKDEQPDQMSISIMQGAGANKGTVDGIWGQIQKKTGELSTYDFSSIAGMSVPGQLKDYVAYDVVLPVNEYDGKAWMFIPDNNNDFGILLKIYKNSKVAAAYTYIPFFADALTPAEKGKVETVSKKESSASNDVQACIRSAEQMNDFFTFENGAGNTSFLGQNGKTEKFVVEQQLDITFDNRKVTFYKDGQQISDDAYQGAYHSVTLNKIGQKNQTYRAKKRPEASTENDYYILDGLRAPLVTEVWGTLCDLQITNMEAQYFVKMIHFNEDVFVRNVFITNAKFATKENPTQGGFAANLQGGSVENCHIYKAQIYGDGFISTTETSGDKKPKISNCSIEDAVIYGNGFGTYFKSTDIENCKIINSVISKNGFAEESMANIEDTTIINAIIGQNGFVKKNAGSIRNCGIYADPFLYSKDTVSNYRPYGNSNGTYDYVSIGIAPGGTKSSENIAGFVQEQIGGKDWNQSIRNCYVIGTIYGENSVSGFIGNAKQKLLVENCYANVIIDAGGDASGFAREINNDSTSIKNCHALGVIKNAKKASGFVRQIHDAGVVNGCYEAFWNVHADEWYPFYEIKSSSQTIQNNYYLTDYVLSVENEELVDYSTHASGLTYQQLCDLNLEGQNNQADTTVGYYRYMNDDNDHKIYPYPMPAGMTAYGDWSHEEPDRYTLLYYEKVNGEYYFHGYATEDGENYMAVETSGVNLENGLLAEKNKTVTEDGYILIIGANGSWSVFGRADNSGNVSSPINNANTSIFQNVSSNADIQKALKALKKKDTDKIYAFQLDKYLAYEDTTKNFASWQTLTQESGGIGISIYSTKGMTPMARFSFQPFFADTVKGAQVSSNGSTADRKISFVVTTDGDEDHDYRIRTLRQLKALSDWDAGIWKNPTNTTVADSSRLEESFDKDDTKRYSYLSTSNENYTGGLKIRQDMDIDVNGTSINFDRLDGTYAGSQYGDRSVMLQNLTYDFADVVAPSGKVSSLLIDQANLQGSATTKAQNGDIAHGGQREFVEYNYGHIQNIIVQNSKLGSAGLLYQNGDVPENVTVETRGNLQQDNQFGYWNPDNGHNIYRYLTVISYQIDNHVKTGTISGCKIQRSSVNGAGFVWSNEGGTISESTVIDCNSVADAGFVKYNRSTYVEVVQQIIQYEYWDGKTWTGDSGGTRVSEEFVKQKGWPLKSEGDTVLNVSVPAMINNCQVVDCTVKENGFVGENTVNTAGSSADNNSGAKAKISNCQVYGTSSYSDMKIGSSSGDVDVNEVAGFVGNNGKGAEIENCSVTGQVGGRKNVAGFALTNAGTITGSYANTKIACEENQETMLSGFVLTNTGTIDRSHSLGEESCKQVGSGADNQAAGFVVSNQKANDSSTNAVIKNSYAAMWKLELNGTNYVPFGSIDSSSGGSYENCYAMKLSAGDGYSGTYSAANSSEITYVSGEDLQKKCNDRLGNEAEDGKTTAYQAELKSTNYPFPCGSTIMNYGDWKLTDGNSAAAHTITLAAGSMAVFPEDVVRSLSADAAVMAASDDGNTEHADEAAITGTENAYGQDTIPEEDRHEVQLELGEGEETLDLAELVPVRKGWKLLGWLITSPSELSASEKTTTVSDVVTKINKLSDGDAEASGSSKAVYELETGTKSYHYAPDAVITVTEDMTLSAVWVPDDDTIEKAKDGTLRMDENGNILEDKNEAESTGTTETTEEGTTESSTAGTTEIPEEGTTEPSTAGTTETPEEGTTESGTTGTTESPEEGTTESSTTGTTEMSETGATESMESSSSGTETSAPNRKTSGSCDEGEQ